MPKDIVDELNTCRFENRLGQVRPAEKLEVTFQTVNRWLNRHMKPRTYPTHRDPIELRYDVCHQNPKILRWSIIS